MTGLISEPKRPSSDLNVKTSPVEFLVKPAIDKGLRQGEQRGSYHPAPRASPGNTMSGGRYWAVGEPPYSAETSEVRLSVEEIEDFLGPPVPASARKNQSLVVWSQAGYLAGPNEHGKCYLDGPITLSLSAVNPYSRQTKRLYASANGLSTFHCSSTITGTEEE